MPATVRADGVSQGAPMAVPSPEARLLLLAVTAPEPEAADAWARWLRTVDFEDLEHGATGLLNLVDDDLAASAADASVAGRVRGVRRQTWARNRVLWAASAPLVDHLGAEVGPPLLLPPTALLHLHDGDWGARPLDRLHLSLPTAAAAPVRAALAETGWSVDHLTPALLERTRAGLVQRWQAQDPAGRWVTVRWHVLPGISSSVVDEQLHGAALPATVDGSAVRVLHPADALLHRAWVAPAERTWGWIADVVVLARRLVAHPADLDRCARRVAHLGVGSVVADRLALAADTVGDPAVRAVLEALTARPTGALAVLHRLPPPAATLGRAWAGHAAGQGLAAGGRSLLRAQWTARQLRYRGSTQRR